MRFQRQKNGRYRHIWGLTELELAKILSEGGYKEDIPPEENTWFFSKRKGKLIFVADLYRPEYSHPWIRLNCWEVQNG